MTCPNCGECQQCINELDSSIVCGSCGTVLDDPDLVSYDDNVVHRKGGNDALIPTESLWFQRTATYYGLPAEYIEAGKNLYKKHRLELPKLAYNEISVGIICYVGRDLKPTWQYEDFIAAFPYPLHKPSVIKTFICVSGALPSSEAKLSNQFDYATDQIYGIIKKEMYPRKAPKNFTSEKMKSYCKKLLSLGEKYGLNAGKKIRPLITAAACLSALHLQTKQPIRRVRDSKRVGEIKKEYYFNWKFNRFSCFVFASPRYIQDTYNAYYQMIYQGVKRLAWIKCDNVKDSIFYLDDFLDFFLATDNQKPKMELDSILFWPSSYMKSLARSEILEVYINEAKQHITLKTNPEDPFSLVNSIITLLKAGYDEKEFIEWTPGYMRSFSNMLIFRNAYMSDIQTNRNLDNPLVNSNDMSNEEINIYLV
ncbi:uncharacterized protein EV154DRAFT_493549 [Mucor mucedo]|uniref:uncharacterized protein n=1 Tax=Mucor mucedo TaxID=29922 RepID=UPI00221F276E|nr:uncharacterized protein EV154DRAFT_493549 [Mucor mucedo]KAI7896116.1 hypothetical protein EV154DRAFT_493549 [Mucor mucedo]